MRSIKSSEKGQALIVIALSAVALIGFVGLAVDGSARYSDRRNAQNAADTAALAAALEKVNALTDGIDNTPAECPPTSGLMSDASDVCAALVLAGLDRADSNGYDNSNSTIEIYSPPISGYYVNNSDYVQVIITSHLKTTFMRIFGVAQADNVVSAVAYMKEGRNLTDGAMIISYDPDPNCSTTGTGGYSVQVNGSAQVNLDGGGIFINSDETCGFKIPNCADLNITNGGTVNTVGADNVDTTGCTFDPPLSPNYDQDPLVIPDDVYWPDTPPECNQLASATNYPLGSDYWYITPGYYTDFPQSNINGNLVANKKHIIMQPGVYCVGGDIHWSGNTFKSLDGSSGVTIYIKEGYEFSLSINSPVTLYGSTSGDYQGYLLIQEGTHTDINDCIINGGAYLDIEGLIYAPYCDFTINGQAGEDASINAQVVGWDIKINGNNTINFNYDPSNQVILKRRVGLMK